MSDVPELRELVRGVAERRARRRRARIALRVAIPAVAVAAACALLLSVDRGDDEVPAVSTPAPTATPEPNPFDPVRRDPATPPATLTEARALAEPVFGVLRRPARKSDRFGKHDDRGRARIPVEADWDNVRRVAKLDDREEFVMSGTWDGKPGICVATKNRRGAGISTCTGGLPTFGYPLWSRTTEHTGPVYFVLFPDGVDGITLHLKSGEQIKRKIVDNGILFQQRGLKEISWRDPSGQEHRKRLAV